MARLSKAAPTSGSKFAKLVKGLADELETSHAVLAKAEKEEKRQKRLVSMAEKSANNALNDVGIFAGQFRLPVRGSRNFFLAYQQPSVR